MTQHQIEFSLDVPGRRGQLREIEQIGIEQVSRNRITKRREH